MKTLEAEARKIVRLGDAAFKKKGLQNFHLEAQNIVVNSKYCDLFDVQELLEGSFKKEFKQIQNFGSLQFSDLPVTVARGDNCFLDLYFWRRRPTVIHNHHFAGAFQCLMGLNVDLEFEWKKERKLGSFHSMGKLKIKETKILKKGDSESIGFLDSYIHQNHHQADLTVNLCLRTPEVKKTNLSNYLFGGLKFEKCPQFLSRTQRLHRVLGMQEMNIDKIEIDLDDALQFLIATYESGLQDKRLLKLRRSLLSRVKSEWGINPDQMLKAHEFEMDRQQELYD